MTSTAAIIGTKGLATSTPLATGQLLISGYLTRWNELDRQADRMVRGAFSKAIPAFLNGHAPLLYAHSPRDVLGTVIEMAEDAVGLKMTARVNRQPKSSPLRWIWEALRNRTIKGLSCGAIFHRQARADGTADIVQADILEASVTATPQLASTRFEVVAEGKSVGGDFAAHYRATKLRRAEAAVEMLSLKLAAAELAAAVAEARRSRTF